VSICHVGLGRVKVRAWGVRLGWARNHACIRSTCARSCLARPSCCVTAADDHRQLARGDWVCLLTLPLLDAVSMLSRDITVVSHARSVAVLSMCVGFPAWCSTSAARIPLVPVLLPDIKSRPARTGHATTFATSLVLNVNDINIEVLLCHRRLKVLQSCCRWPWMPEDAVGHVCGVT